MTTGKIGLFSIVENMATRFLFLLAFSIIKVPPSYLTLLSLSLSLPPSLSPSLSPSLQSGGPDFSLTSFQARNRALQDDVVVVEPLEYVDPAPSGTSVQQQQPPDISSLTLQDESPVVGSEATPTPKDTPIAARGLFSAEFFFYQVIFGFIIRRIGREKPKDFGL